MSKKENSYTSRNVDDDITKCEEFLCRILNARVEPLELTALQNALDNNKLMASNRQNLGSSQGSRAQKHVRHLTPPVKLSRSAVPRRLEPDNKHIEKNKQNQEKSRSRSASCCSERSSKPSAPLREENISENNNTALEEALLESAKCKNKSSTHIIASRQSWSQLLTENRKMSTSKMLQNTNILPGTFSQFDPLRTLHFLTKELQSKLYAMAPDDMGVHRIVSEIQQSLHRLPIPSKTEILSGRSYADMPAYLGQQYIEGRVSQVSQTSAIAVVHQHCQTEETMKQKDLELSCLKLELNCKNLNDACDVANVELEDLRKAVIFHKNNNEVLQTEIEDMKRRASLSPNTEKLVEELKIQVQTLQDEKLALFNEKQFKINLLEETIQKLKKNIDEDYSTYLKMKLDSDQKNAVISAKDIQLEILTKELHHVQEVVKIHICEHEDITTQNVLTKSHDRLSKCRDKFLTPASSLSTLAESAPCGESKYDLGKSGKGRHGANTFCKSYDTNMKDHCPFKDDKSSQDESRYVMNRRYHERKRRPESPVDQAMKDSMSLNKMTNDTDGGSRGDVTTVANIFKDIRDEVLKNANVTLPSPPRQFQMPDMSSSQSQWSDST